MMIACSSLVANAIDDNSVNTANTSATENSVDPEVYVTKVTTSGSTFKAGDTIDISADFLNGSLYPIGSFSYVLTLGDDFDEAGNPFTVFDTKNMGKLSLSAKGKLSQSFKYTIPRNASGDKLRVQISAVLPSGFIMGMSESPEFSVSGGSPILATKNAYVEVLGQDGNSRGEKFPLSAGVTINKEKSPNAKVTLDFFNSVGEDINLNSKIVMYERSVIQGDVVGEFNLDSFSIKQNTKKSLIFNVPTLNYKPGVYEGVIIMNDKNGISRTEPITFHYIIKGESAIVHTAKSDKMTVSKGERFNVSLLLTGEPMDSFFEDEEKLSEVDVLVTVNDENGQVAQKNSALKIGSFETNANIELVSEKDSGYLSVNVQVKNSKGEIIAEYSEPLSSEITEGEEVELTIWDTVKDNLLLGIVILFALVMMIIFFVYYRKSRLPVITTLSLLLVTGSIAFAQYQGDLMKQNTKTKKETVFSATGARANYNMKVFFDTPVDDMTFSPGAELKIRGHANFIVCLNHDYKLYGIFGNGAGEISPLNSLGVASVSGPHAYAWKSKNFTYTLTAPTNPGRYVATIKFQRDYQDERGFVDRTVRTAYQPYSVVDPSCTGSRCFGSGVRDCPEGSFYCDVTMQCVADGSACNPGDPNFLPDIENPLIPRDITGPVSLKPLELKQSIVNKGNSCTITWSNSFNAYDRYTVCTFSGPGSNNGLTFAASTTNQTSFTSSPLQSDTLFKMSCVQVDNTGASIAGTTKSSDAVCRVNLNYKEVN